jgi:hypothetical protein
MRTCSTVFREDCKEEKSSETYCHCKNNLCNTPERKLSDPGFGAPSHSRREGVARALLQSGTPLNSAMSDDEDLAKSHHIEGSGDSDNEDYFDATYFGEYEDDGEDSDDATDAAASPPGDVDVTEPPPFIVEEEIAKWKPKLGDKIVKDGDIDFEDGGDDTIKWKDGGNVNDPSERNINSNKRITNGALNVVPCTALLLFVSQLVLVLVAKLIRD